jgi:hypothetical protein
VEYKKNLPLQEIELRPTSHEARPYTDCDIVAPRIKLSESVKSAVQEMRTGKIKMFTDVCV